MKPSQFRCALCGGVHSKTDRHTDDQYGDICGACHDLVNWTDCLSVDPQSYEAGYIVRPMTRDEQIVYRSLGGVED